MKSDRLGISASDRSGNRRAVPGGTDAGRLSKIKFRDMLTNLIYMLDPKPTPFTNFYINLRFFDYVKLLNKLLEARKNCHPNYRGERFEHRGAIYSKHTFIF